MCKSDDVAAKFDFKKYVVLGKRKFTDTQITQNTSKYVILARNQSPVKGNIINTDIKKAILQGTNSANSHIPISKIAVPLFPSNFS